MKMLKITPGRMVGAQNEEDVYIPAGAVVTKVEYGEHRAIEFYVQEEVEVDDDAHPKEA